MAKTTATVTVGADTSPFERKMRTLGKGISGGITMGAGRLGGMAMSGLGAGIGFGALALGVGSLSSVFSQLLAVSPALNAAFTKLQVAIGQTLLPAADAFAKVLITNMPAIQSGLKVFGDMIADAIQFWTVDAFNPAVWKDIGKAIAESVSESMREAIPKLREGATGMVESGTGSPMAGEVAGALYDLNPIVLQQRFGAFLLGLLSGSETEGAKSL